MVKCILDGVATKDEFIAKVSERGLIMYQQEKNNVSLYFVSLNSHEK